MPDQPQGTPLIARQPRSAIGSYDESASLKADRLHKDNELWRDITIAVLEYHKDGPDKSDDKVIATLDRLWTWMNT